MKLLGKLYLDPKGRYILHSKRTGKYYIVFEDGECLELDIKYKHISWRLIGDSYAKD